MTSNIMPIFVQQAMARGQMGEVKQISGIKTNLTESKTSTPALARASGIATRLPILSASAGRQPSYRIPVTMAMRSAAGVTTNLGPSIPRANNVQTELYVAAHRFGYGPHGDSARSDSLSGMQTRGNARQWLLGQIGDAALRRIAASPYGFGENVNGQKVLYNTGDAFREYFIRSGNTQFVPGVMGADGNFGDYDAGQLNASLRHQSLSWARQAAMTEFPFAHSLVSFFANYLCVRFSCEMANRAAFGGQMTAYFNALIPLVLADNTKYEDVLIGALQHPAMQIQYSMHNSRNVDWRGGTGVVVPAIEDAPREILRLLTVQQGYTQDHVATLARLLTGWSHIHSADASQAGRFRFSASEHASSPTNWSAGPYDLRPLIDWRTDAYPPQMDYANEASVPAAFRDYPRGAAPANQLSRVTVEIGLGKALEVLRLLARHPDTAKSLCERLVQHYITDNVTSGPGFEIVQAMRAEYTRTNGQLSAVFRAMINHRNALATGASYQKYKTPIKYYLSVLRGAKLIAEKPYAQPLITSWAGILSPNAPGSGQMVREMSAIPLPSSHGDDILADLLFRILPQSGHSLFNPPSVQGYLDNNSRWQTSSALESRYREVAQNYLTTVAAQNEPNMLIERTVGPALRASNRTASRLLMTAAERVTAMEQIAATLLSPEMQMQGAVL